MEAPLVPDPEPGFDRFEALRDPWRVRVLTVALIAAIGGAFVQGAWSEQARVAAQCKALIERRAITDRIRDRRERLATLAPYLPAAGCDVTAWLDRIKRAAHEAGLGGVAIHYKEANGAAVGGYRPLAIEVDFEGEFRPAVTFLHWIETSTPRPRPAQFKLERGTKKNQALCGRISFRVLLAEDAERLPVAGRGR